MKVKIENLLFKKNFKILSIIIDINLLYLKIQNLIII